MAGKRKTLSLEEKRAAAAEAALVLAASTPWRTLSPQAIVAEAGLDLSDLYDIGGKAALLAEIDRHFDRTMGAGLSSLSPDASGPERRERLLDVMMQRFDAMEMSRAGLASIRAFQQADAAERLRAARRRYRTAEWALEAAEISGPGLAAKAAALTATFLKIERIWESDEAPLDRTMAAIDRDLRRYADWMKDLSRVAKWMSQRSGSADAERSAEAETEAPREDDGGAPHPDAPPPPPPL